MDLIKGTKFYYPSTNGMALLCEVMDESKEDYLVQIESMHFYIPKKSVRDHGIVIDEAKAKAFVSQRIEDPDNDIVYLRYQWNETLVDRFYNWYCRKVGRVSESIRIPGKKKGSNKKLKKPDFEANDYPPSS